jgi:hypothetical protein
LQGGTAFDGRGHVGGDFLDSRQQQWGLQGGITGDGGGRIVGGELDSLQQWLGLARRWSRGLASELAIRTTGREVVTVARTAVESGTGEFLLAIRTTGREVVMVATGMESQGLVSA